MARLLRRSYDAMAYLPTLHTPDEDRAFIAGIVLPNQEVWIAEDDERVIGFAALSHGVLNHIYVAPEAQNAGVGKALLDRAKERMPRGFTLWTFQANERARRFYEREGLHVAQLTDGEHNEEKTPDVQYEWRP